jgi:hypothetical protein
MMVKLAITAKSPWIILAPGRKTLILPVQPIVVWSHFPIVWIPIVSGARGVISALKKARSTVNNRVHCPLPMAKSGDMGEIILMVRARSAAAPLDDARQ